MLETRYECLSDSSKAGVAKLKWFIFVYIQAGDLLFWGVWEALTKVS